MKKYNPFTTCCPDSECPYRNNDGYCKVEMCDKRRADLKAKERKRTNADSIRNMTDEELASLLSPVCVHGLAIEHGECDKEDKSFCVDCWLDWLKKEVEE